jgi:hypothetical protein
MSSRPPADPRRAQRRLAVARARAAIDGASIAAWPKRLAPEVPRLPPYPKIFVVGCPRSGTTWVQHLIQSHQQVVGTEESHAVKRLGRAAEGGRDPRAWARLLYGLDRDDVLERPVGLGYWVDRPALVRIGRAAVHQTGSVDDRHRFLVTAVLDGFVARQARTDPVLVEKTPFHIKYAADLLRWYPESKVVEVVRDGRDVCASMRRLPPDITFAPPSLELQLRMWVRAIERGIALEELPDASSRVIRVHYERLRADPKHELTRLFAFLGLDASTDFVRTVVEELEFSNAKASGRGLHMHSGVVGSWRTVFDEREARLLERIGRRTLERAGYAW